MTIGVLFQMLAQVSTAHLILYLVAFSVTVVVPIVLLGLVIVKALRSKR